MERLDSPPETLVNDRVMEHLAGFFQALHRRLDTLDRHAANLMFLQLSSQEVVLGQRRHFSEASRRTILRTVAAQPYGGVCPCCAAVPVLTEAGKPMPGAEFDHFFHRGLNRPELGWLVCEACHDDLSHGTYIGRFVRFPEFRAFQAAVLRQRRRP